MLLLVRNRTILLKTEVNSIMYDILTEQLKHYTVLWRETSALYEEWAKKHGLSYYELLVILSIM